jgi:hypothetical protein
MTRTVFIALVIVVFATALAAFVAIAVGIWSVTAAGYRRADWALGEALTAIDRARPVARVIRETIDAAAADLQAARPPAPADIPAAKKMLLRSALKGSPDKVEAASRAVDGLGDLLVVAHAALTTLKDLPGTDDRDVGDLEGLRRKLAGSSDALHKADAILRATTGKRDDAVAAEDLRTVESALADARVAVVEVEGQLDATRSRVAGIREQLPDWLNYATWAIAALSVLGALGQVALIRWCLRSRRPASPE